MTDQPRGRSGADLLPERVTMPLLTLITQQSLDEDYAHVARRRALDEPQPNRGRPQRTAAVVVGVFGILVATAAVQTAQNADETQASRSTLVARVNDRRDSVAALQDRIEELRLANEDAQDGLSRATAATVTAQSRLRRLQVRTGYIPVQGEGVRITVSDGLGEDDEVTEIELQKLVNGLWQSGAEAVAINDQRLTALTAIKNSGRVVNVNSVPLNPPYVVEAIGDRRTLQADLLDSQGGQEFATAVAQYGFGFEMVNVERLQLPQAPTKALRHAELLPPDQPRPDSEESQP